MNFLNTMMRMFVAYHRNSPHKFPFKPMVFDSVVQVSGLVPLKPAPFETFKRGVLKLGWDLKEQSKYNALFKQSQINFKKLLNSKPKYDIMATLNTTYGG